MTGALESCPTCQRPIDDEGAVLAALREALAALRGRDDVARALLALVVELVARQDAAEHLSILTAEHHAAVEIEIVARALDGEDVDDVASFVDRGAPAVVLAAIRKCHAAKVEPRWPVVEDLAIFLVRRKLRRVWEQIVDLTLDTPTTAERSRAA